MTRGEGRWLYIWLTLDKVFSHLLGLLPSLDQKDRFGIWLSEWQQLSGNFPGSQLKIRNKCFFRKEWGEKIYPDIHTHSYCLILSRNFYYLPTQLWVLQFHGSKSSSVNRATVCFLFSSTPPLCTFVTKDYFSYAECLCTDMDRQLHFSVDFPQNKYNYSFGSTDKQLTALPKARHCLCFAEGTLPNRHNNPIKFILQRW